MKKKSTKKLNTRNSKILHDTVVSLGALKGASNALQEMHINEIQVHLLDEEGDGVILCIEYDEHSGELKKTFHNTEDAYYDEDEDEEGDTEVDVPHYYGEHTQEELDACASPENVKEFLKARIEETISEEYDEIFHSATKKPSSLLN